MSDTIDPNFFNFVAQMSHFFFGAYFILASALLFGQTSVLGAFIILIIGAALKEFIYDANYENAATRGSDTEDFIFYVFGGVVGAYPILLLSPYRLN